MTLFPSQNIQFLAQQNIPDAAVRSVDLCHARNHAHTLGGYGNAGSDIIIFDDVSANMPSFALFP